MIEQEKLLTGTWIVHQIIGGNAFNASMPSADISALASCTTCGPADDLSNYWTANLYFKARNGSYKRVPQVPNRQVCRFMFVSCCPQWFRASLFVAAST